MKLCTICLLFFYPKHLCFFFVVNRPEIPPGGTSTGTPVSSVSPEIISSSTPGCGDAAPSVPFGQALAFQQLLARTLDLLYYGIIRNIVYNVIVNHFRQQQHATSLNIEAAPEIFGERDAVTEEPVVGISLLVPIRMRRGMLKFMRNNVHSALICSFIQFIQLQDCQNLKCLLLKLKQWSRQ